MIKRLLMLLLCAMLLIGLIIPVNAFAEEETMSAISIQNAGNYLTLGKGQGFQLTVADEKGNTPDVVWKTSKKKAVRVSQTGYVKARKKGTATIKCYLKDDSAVFDYVVISIGSRATSLRFTETNNIFSVGEQRKLKYTILPQKTTNKSVLWNSSDESVASVDENGIVTGIAEGSAVITVMTNDGTNLEDSFEITVKPIPSVDDSLFVAHRGDMTNAPENTLPAFQNAIDAGYKYVEFDVWESITEKSEDPFLYIMHDTSTGRMCGAKSNKAVFALTRNTIDNYPVIKGTNMSSYGGSLKIPTLEETLDLVFSSDNDIVPMIHIQSLPIFSISDEALLKIIELCGDHEVIVLTINSDVMKRMVKLGMPDTMSVWVSTAGRPVINIDDIATEYEFVDVKAITVSTNNITPAIVEAIHEHGMIVNSFPIKTYNEYFKLKELGVDSMTCNFKVFE